MKLIHFTARRFQYLTADSFYVSNLAEAFHKILKDDYLLVMAGKLEGQFDQIKTVNLKIKDWKNPLNLYFWLPVIIYFFWTPYFVRLKNLSATDVYFFSSDPNLLCILIFWKKIFRYKFIICSDWHLMYNNWKDNFIASNSDKLITTSNKLRDFLINKTKINPEKIHTIYGAVNAERFKNVDKNQIRKILNLPIDKKFIGYVGLFKTMGMEKGVGTMIRSLPILSENMVMVFVGGKEDEIIEYKNLAIDLNVLDKCIFMGRKNFDEVVLYEQAMDALVIPYPDKPHFRNYGFPMKVYEYMAARRPIVYSILEMTEEVLIDSGFAFKPDDPEDLAKTIKYVFNNTEEAD
jgi:glycosyltransferase involved in cell wall biosynthesis